MVSADALGNTIAYAYDPLGRRASKTVNGTVTEYLSAGDQEIAEYDGSGTLLRRYVFGPGIDEPVATIDASSGTKTYSHQDGLGSVIALSDGATGTVTDSYAYDPYGQSTTLAGSAFRFTGRRLDAESGLYYYRARYYSPALGRFLQTDPIETQGGVNLYAYVENDPLNFVDPSGMIIKKALQSAIDIIRRLEPGPFAKEGIPVEPGRVPASVRKRNTEIGLENGCHNCGTKDPGTASGHFVTDHIPPQSLANGQPMKVYPSCINCSYVQGGKVRGVLNKAKKGLTVLGGAIAGWAADEALAAQNDPINFIYQWSPLQDVEDFYGLAKEAFTIRGAK